MPICHTSIPRCWILRECYCALIPERKSKFFFTLNFLNRSRILSGQNITCCSKIRFSYYYYMIIYDWGCLIIIQVVFLFRLPYYSGCLVFILKKFIWKRRCSQWTMQRLIAVIHALIALNKYWLLVNLGFKLPLFYCLWFWFHLNSFQKR